MMSSWKKFRKLKLFLALALAGIVAVGIMDGWRTKPFLVESILVTLFSAAAMVAFLAMQRLQVQRRRLEHINRVLLGIRNVNQLSVTESDPRRLIERACVNLTETMGYFNVWIALLGGEAARGLGLPDTGPVAAAAAAGFDGGFKILREHLERGEFPDCMNRSLEAGRLLIVGDPAADCPGCPLHADYGGCAGLARSLEFEGVVYGILTASVPAAYAQDAEEQDLFNEVAGDLAFALHNIATARGQEDTRRRYREIFRHSRDGFVMVDAAGRILDANDAFCAMLGYTLDELRALPDFYKITPERWREWEAEEIWEKRLLSQGNSGLYEKEYIHKDGTVFPVELRSYVVRCENGEIDYLWGTARDITERKRMERHNRVLADIIKRSRDFIGVADLHQDAFFVNPAGQALVGLDGDEAVAKTKIEEYFLPEDLPFFENTILPAMMKDGRWAGEFRFRHFKTGAPVPVLYELFLTEDSETGAATNIATISRDITDRKRAEEALRERTDLLQNITNHMFDMVAMTDMDGVFTYAGPSHRMLGFEPGQLLGTSVFEYVHPDDADHVAEEFAAFIAYPSPDTQRTIEYRQRCKDGTYLWLETMGKILFSDDGAPCSLFFSSRNITERRRADEALQESERRVRTKLNALLDPGGDLETLNLADVVDCAQIQSLMDDFHALTDIGAGIVDLEGRVLVGTGWQDICMTFHRVHPDTARNCRESDTLLASDVEPGTFKVYKCKNNMWDMVTPIMIGEKHVGNLFLGQFFFDDEEPNLDVFREQARRYGFDEDAYLRAYQSIPRWSRQTVHEVMAFYCNLTGVISRLSYAQIKLARASETLRQSEQRFRSFVENANDMVYALSPEGLFTYMSPNWLDFMGEPAEQAIGRSFEPYVHPDDVHLCRAFLEKTLTTGEKQSSVEYRVRHQSGSWRWHVSNGSPLRDESGTITGYVGIARDVTELKQAEKSLIESEERFRNFFENLSAGSCLDEMVYENGRAVDYRILEVNPAYEAIMGIPREKAVGALGSEVYGLGEAPFLEKLERVAETGDPERFETFFAPIGKHLSFTVSRPRSGMFSTVFFDITASKQVEQALVQSEKNYRDIFDNSSDCIFIHDAATGAIVEVNRATCETFGYPAEEIKQLAVGDFSLNRPPYTSAEAAEWIRRAYQEGPQRFEWLARDRKGRLIWFENNLLYAPIGGKDRILVFGRNIDDRKHAEEKLCRSEDLLNQAQEIAQLGSYVWSIGDDRLEWSRQMFAIAGINVDDFRGNLRETVLNLIYPEDRDGIFEQIRQMLEQKRTWPMEFRLVRPDGGVRWLHSASRFEYDNNGEPVMCVGVHHDITEKKHGEVEKEKLQAQLRQAQKMEAVGRLAGGVAHDFNNMLNVILGHSELMLDDLPPESRLRGELGEIRMAAEHSANLTRQLLAFARKQVVAPKVLDLNDTIASMLKMLQRLIGEDVDLLWKPGRSLPSVRIDPGQVDQVLANLVVNARDAIGHANGKITIETANVCFDEEYCATHAGFRPGDYVMLAVSDDGCGMDEETRTNIFEPFFTTKGVGEGTGLGLATVYGIAKQNDGFINVYSEPGNGTTFRIYLPALEAESRQQDHARKTAVAPTGGNETILVVEDQPALLELARRMLERLGYTVLTAATPGEALRVARDDDCKLDLLITDVVMPEMSGHALAQQLQPLCPRLKNLFMSGYTANVIAHRGVLDEGVNFIQKPFSAQDLASKVREVLES